MRRGFQAFIFPAFEALPRAILITIAFKNAAHTQQTAHEVARNWFRSRGQIGQEFYSNQLYTLMIVMSINFKDYC